MKVFIILSAVLFYALFDNKVQSMQKKHDESEYLQSVDTPAIVKITDSLASVELEKYDKQSGRQTGVPRFLSHYDKRFSFNKEGKIFIVHYSFNQQKFYGENWKQITPLSTGFPDIFHIAYNIITKKVRLLQEG